MTWQSGCKFKLNRRIQLSIVDLLNIFWTLKRIISFVTGVPNVQYFQCYLFQWKFTIFSPADGENYLSLFTFDKKLVSKCSRDFRMPRFKIILHDEQMFLCFSFSVFIILRKHIVLLITNYHSRISKYCRYSRGDKKLYVWLARKTILIVFHFSSHWAWNIC